MPVTATVAVVGAGLLDALVGEPPRAVHPVAVFGGVVGALDRPWARPHLVGTLAATLLPLGAAGVVGGTVVLAGLVDPWAGAAVAGVGLFVTTSLRMLRSEALAVVAATEDDLPAARARLPALVGRDPETLSAAEVRSAAVESAAENLADGLVAPLSAFAIGALVGLPVAAGAAAWVKAVNTLDSMLGYRSKPVGRAAARLDDAVMFGPARLAAVLLALGAGDPRAVWRARRWAGRPRSPNSGWPMATLAAVLGTRFRKPGDYELGATGPLPTLEVATRGVAIVTRAGAVAVALAGVVAWF